MNRQTGGGNAAAPPSVERRFVADRMLGRLARWMRILGCDVLYGSNFAGRGLLRAARSEGRIVLTRDKRLVRDAEMPPHLLIEHDRVGDQLREVVSAFAIDPFASLFRRCADCNAEVAEVGRESVTGEVPEFVHRTQGRFHRCPRCRHVYWEGTHVARVRAELERFGFAPGSPGPPPGGVNR
jgi:hypothetical protein